MELNPSQDLAIKTVNGRVLILAGAGSGKTRVLTMRMAHLVKNLNVSPRSILGLTFTNKAAAEMRHRIGKMVEPHEAKQIALCTFHSFCLNILRAEIHRLGYTHQFTLYDQSDMQRLINYICRDLLERDKEMPSLVATTSAIVYAKNKGLKAEEIQGTGSNWHDEFTRTVYKRLGDSLRAYNAVDFDNLLSLTVELFEKHRDVLEKYQDRFRYIMIDEYQDTNPIQYRLAALLSSKYNNLCVVGDDDQSIYGWRGAEVRNILEFGDATVIKLEQNYRSTNTILKAANEVINKNTQRFSKVLWSMNGEGKPIELFHAPTELDEAEAVICRILKLKEEMNLRWKDFAILYRSNALSRQFELSLMKHGWQDGSKWMRGIPYQVFGGLEFYERREVKDIHAYLRAITNPRDQEALLRIINQPRRGIGEGTLDALTAYNRLHNMPLWNVLLMALQNPLLPGKEVPLPDKALQGLKEFVDTLEEARRRFQEGPLYETLKWLIEKIDYKRAIEEEVKSTQMREFKWENVQEFVSALAEYEQSSEREDEPSLQEFITSIPLKSGWEQQSKKQNMSEDKISLMTFHSSKGLEFPVCFLVGVEDHIIPHEKSMKQTGIEEERRLMYVAITRAMKHLTISMARQRKRMGRDTSSQPSRFLFDIPKELLNLTAWDQI